MPMPPWREMPMARRDSVTVSIAAEASGMLMVSLRVNCVVVSTSVGRTEDLPGRSRTSSNVRPSGIGPSIMETSRDRIGRGTVRRHKQRSPAGKRWAGGQMQPIEKMSHGELSILGAAGREGQVTVGEGPDNDSDLHQGHRRAAVRKKFFALSAGGGVNRECGGRRFTGAVVAIAGSVGRKIVNTKARTEPSHA